MPEPLEPDLSVAADSDAEVVEDGEIVDPGRVTADTDVVPDAEVVQEARVAAPGAGSVTVVVCADREQRFEALRSTVSAVLDQLRRPSDELVLVIDHNDGLLELAETSFERVGGWSNPDRMRVVANDQTKGLSGARNTGVAAAKGDLVVFLDGDAIPRPDWLANLITGFRDPSVVGVGGVAVPNWQGAPPAWFPDEFRWVVGCSYTRLTERVLEVRTPIGANMAFRRQTVLDAGRFSDGIDRVGRLGSGVREFSIRAVSVTGGRIVQHSNAVVDQFVALEQAQLAYFARRCFAEGASEAAMSKVDCGDSAFDDDYVVQALFLGVVRGVVDGARGDASGFERAGAIIVGFAIILAGHVYGLAAGFGVARRRGRLGRLNIARLGLPRRGRSKSESDAREPTPSPADAAARPGVAAGALDGAEGVTGTPGAGGQVHADLERRARDQRAFVYLIA